MAKDSRSLTHSCGCLAAIVVLGLCALVGWRAWLTATYKSHMYTAVGEVPPRRVAIVFGAGVRNGRPTSALADRIEAAVALYHAGKVQKLLMTGDNRFLYYNEPAAMKAYAQELGVPVDAIVLDYAGRRTYDSCYRASAIFGITEAVLVTHGFHQARAAYLCDHLGVDPVGYAANNRHYRRLLRWQWEVRETIASAAAWWDIHVTRPTPVLGEPIPIGD